MLVQFHDRLAEVEEGPWTGEPDKAQWVDPTTDLDCLIVRGHHGALCGYVGIPFEHKLHGADFHDVPVEIHDHLSFASFCDEEFPDGICHVPQPGRPVDLWWLGFSCAGWRDIRPYTDHVLKQVRLTPVYAGMPQLPEEPEWMRATYKDVAYVKAECESLAAQLIKLA